MTPFVENTLIGVIVTVVGVLVHAISSMLSKGFKESLRADLELGQKAMHEENKASIEEMQLENRQQYHKTNNHLHLLDLSMQKLHDKHDSHSESDRAEFSRINKTLDRLDKR